MQVASRQPMWDERGRGTVIDIELTEATGLYVRFMLRSVEGRIGTVKWGDGSKDEFDKAAEWQVREHVFSRFGRYRIRFSNASRICIRDLDGQGRPQYPFDPAILSFVDYSGDVTGSNSAAFKRCVNLERYIAPNCQWLGQRDFAYCTKLREVVVGASQICYDGTFQYCSALEKYTCKSTGICWSYVWQGCTSLRELRLGEVSQFATKDFQNTPNLMDIWIDGKTVEQIKQVAPSGNIVAGYGAKFPWGANAACRFHGSNGIVLGDGTIIHS